MAGPRLKVGTRSPLRTSHMNASTVRKQRQTRDPANSSLVSPKQATRASHRQASPDWEWVVMRCGRLGVGGNAFSGMPLSSWTIPSRLLPRLRQQTRSCPSAGGGG
eukprot:1538590-Pyramimonas_sp.AAC.1